MDNLKLSTFINFDKWLAITGVVFSISFVIFQGFGFSNYSLVGVLTFLACIVWLMIRKNASLDYESKVLLSDYKAHCFSFMFFILFIFSLLLFYFRPTLYQRPLLYFICIAFMVGVLFIQILFSKLNVYLLLFEITIVGLSISWSQLLVFPSLVGVDTWYHQYVSLMIMNTHFIPNNFSYSKLPIFHLLTCFTCFICDLDYKFSTMISVGLTHIVCNMLFIFLLGRSIFNTRIGLLSALVLTVSNYHIFMSFWSIPNSLGGVYILIIICILFTLNNNASISAKFLLLLFMFVLILTHTISAMFMCITLFTLWFLSSIYHKSGITIMNNSSFLASLTIFILFTVSMLGWWIFASGHISTLLMLFKWGFARDFIVHTPYELSILARANTSFFERIFSILGTYIYFSLSFIGIFYMISSQNRYYLTSSMAIIGISPLFIGFFSLVTNHSVVEDRWWYFAQMLLSIPISVTILLLFVKTSNNLKNMFTLFFLTVLITTTLVMSPVANVDNNIFTPHSSMRLSLTTSELSAIERISMEWNGTIYTDRFYADSQKYAFETQPFDDKISLDNLDDIDNLSNLDDLDQLDGLILVRKYIIENPFKIFESVFVYNYAFESKFNKVNYLNIYDCGTVDGFKNQTYIKRLVL